MPDVIDWFPRLADIPNIGYASSPGVNRPRLPGHGAKPRVEVSQSDSGRRESIWWPSRDGEGSASPVKQYLSRAPEIRDEPSEALIKRLREALELPGQPSDYHFAIQSCIEELWAWKRRRVEPWLLGEIEQFCWIDIQLVEEMPHIIVFEYRGQQLYARVTAFDHLIQLYEREGFVEDALGVARRATRFYPDFPKLQELEQRVAQLASEMNG